MNASVTRLSFWQKKGSPPDNARLYISGLGGIAPDEKAWVFPDISHPDGWGVKVNAGGLGRARIVAPLGDALRSKLHAQNDLKPDEPVTWERLKALALAQTPPEECPATPARTGKVPTRSNPARNAAAFGGRQAIGHAQRAEQAERLDLLSIPCPGPIDILIDHREPEALAELLASHPAVRIMRGKALHIGDIILNGRIVVERKCCNKDPGDFSASILDGRLFRQVEAMALSDMSAILLIEGDLYGNNSRIPLIQQIDGFVSYSLACMHLSVLQTYNLRHTAYLMIKLAAHDRFGLAQRPNVFGPKPKHLFDARRDVLMRLPGVSWEIADRLLRRFGSVANIVTAERDQLLEVEGLGPTTANAVMRLVSETDPIYFSPPNPDQGPHS